MLAHERNRHAEGDCLPIPNGIKFIFGYDMLTHKSPTGSLWFNCQGPGAVEGHYPNLNVALENCPERPRTLVGAIIEAPSCWDGKNLDSPNHRDHVGYASYGSWGYQKCELRAPLRNPDVHARCVVSGSLGNALFERRDGAQRCSGHHLPRRLFRGLGPDA